jgi:nucleotide-binding universal stress UspA family protein
MNAGTELRDSYRQTFRAQASTRLRELLDRVPSSEARWQPVVQLGGARSVVLEFVRDGRVDLLVIGTHGRGPLGRLFLGSVAEDLIKEATCDVLVWRTGT